MPFSDPQTAMSDNTPSLELWAALNPAGNLDRSFYEAIVLLSLLGPQEDSRVSRSSLKASAEAARTPRHDFLDHLSWYRCGGKTVTSVAAEALSHSSTFWIACNQSPPTKSLKHLEWVLQELESLSSSSHADLDSPQKGLVCLPKSGHSLCSLTLVRRN